MSALAGGLTFARRGSCLPVRGLPDAVPKSIRLAGRGRRVPQRTGSAQSAVRPCVGEGFLQPLGSRNRRESSPAAPVVRLREKISLCSGKTRSPLLPRTKITATGTRSRRSRILRGKHGRHAARNAASPACGCRVVRPGRLFRLAYRQVPFAKMTGAQRPAARLIVCGG